MKKFLLILTIPAILEGLFPILTNKVYATEETTINPIQYPTLWEKLVVGPYRPYTIMTLLVLLVGLVALLLFLVWKRETRERQKGQK